MAKKSTTRTSANKKLEALGTKLINQANSNDALKDIGKKKNVESLRNALNSLFEEIGPNEYNQKRLNEIIEKCKKLLTLIKENIKIAKGSRNFDLDKMMEEQTTVQDIIFRIESIKIVTAEQLVVMNGLYHTHTTLQKFFKDEI